MTQPDQPTDQIASSPTHAAYDAVNNWESDGGAYERGPGGND